PPAGGGGAGLHRGGAPHPEPRPVQGPALSGCGRGGAGDRDPGAGGVGRSGPADAAHGGGLPGGLGRHRGASAPERIRERVGGASSAASGRRGAGRREARGLRRPRARPHRRACGRLLLARVRGGLPRPPPGRAPRPGIGRRPRDGGPHARARERLHGARLRAAGGARAGRAGGRPGAVVAAGARGGGERRRLARGARARRVHRGAGRRGRAGGRGPPRARARGRDGPSLDLGLRVPAARGPHAVHRVLFRGPDPVRVRIAGAAASPPDRGLVRDRSAGSGPGADRARLEPDPGRRGGAPVAPAGADHDVPSVHRAHAAAPPPRALPVGGAARMILLALGLGLILAGGTCAAALARRPDLAERLFRRLVGLGAAAAAWPALATLADGRTRMVRLAPIAPGGAWAFGLDRLSAWFLVAILAVGAAAAVYGTDYLAPERRHRPVGAAHALLAVLLVALAGVVTSQAAIPFLAAWEVMAVSGYLLVIFESERPDARRAGLLYLVLTHASTIALLAMFAGWGHGAPDLTFGTLAGTPLAAGSARAVLMLALVGFGIKAGIVPLHFWLPGAHAAAPSHVSALLSGVMIKTGIYGLLRVLALLGGAPAWWGWTLLGLGLASGVLGVLWALAQHDLKRLL